VWQPKETAKKRLTLLNAECNLANAQTMSHWQTLAMRGSLELAKNSISVRY
jgi:hypothetical protein